MTYEDELHAGLAKIDVHFLNLVGDTSSLEHSGDEVVDSTVTSPLTENGNDTIAGKTVAGSLGLEQSTIIPPALVTTVHIEVLLVLAELHSDPDAVLIALAVEASENIFGISVTATSIQPTRRLGEPPGEEENESGEEDLEPNWDLPGLVACKRSRATSDTSSENRSNKPEGVVKTRDDTAMGRMGSLDDMERTSSGHDGHSETEQEATSHELANGVVGGGS